MLVQVAETLLVTSNVRKVNGLLDSGRFRVQAFKDPAKALESLRNARWDLFILEDALFGEDILSTVREIKRREPLVPIVLLTAQQEAAYYTDLLEAGADDILAIGLPKDEMNRRLELNLHQRRQAQALSQRNQNLHSITQLTRRMHSATDPYALIQDMIERASTTFHLYGMALMLVEGDGYHFYTGGNPAVVPDGLYETVITPARYDPFYRVMQSNMVQWFQNIKADPNFVPIPNLPDVESAIVLPLSYQDYRAGTLAVFGTPRQPLVNDDLLIYELFASQFVVALNNARYQRSQRISAESSEHLLQAWQRFSPLHTSEDIATSLFDQVAAIPTVTQALVWMYSSDPLQPEPVVHAANETTARLFDGLMQSGHVQQAIDQLDPARAQTLIMQPEDDEPFFPLVKALGSNQMMLVPIFDSARFIGGVMAGMAPNRQYSSDDVRVLCASLAHAAGLSLERATLIQNMAQKSNRLEALLLSTSQGIFFVDETDTVAFCNPQLTERTGINPSEVVGLSPDHLLTSIATRSTDPERAGVQLREAVDRVLRAPTAGPDDYQIVEINLANPQRQLQVEFMAMGEPDSRTGWAGFFRENAPITSSFVPNIQMMDIFTGRIRMPLAQLRGLTAELSEQHSRFSHRDRARYLGNLESGLDRLSHEWTSFVSLFQMEAAGLSISEEQVDLYDMIQRTLDSRTFMELRRQIQVDAPARLPLLALDELRIEQMIHNLFNQMLAGLPRGVMVTVRLEPGVDYVDLVVHNPAAIIPAEHLGALLDPFNVADSAAGMPLDLYIAREIVERHGGRFKVESRSGFGTAVTISLPIVAAQEVRYVRVVQPQTPMPIASAPAIPMQMPPPAPALNVDRIGGGHRVPVSQANTIMSIEGRSGLITRLREKLGEADYEIITYRSGEEAVRDINSVRLDLILLDVNLTDANGLDICERICKRTEVPIILLADEPSEQEKVKALMLGADEYLSRPISDDELMARVNVIIKRRRIPDRTREPLDLGPLYIDFARREVFLNKKPLELTRIEYDLLHTLSVNQGQVLTHKQLLEKVWGPEYQAETQYLWVNVSRLRKKLEPTVDSPRFIHTQPGVGYVFRPA
jgi:two-component system KDP operon response regulator KdpE